MQLRSPRIRGAAARRSARARHADTPPARRQATLRNPLVKAALTNASLSFTGDIVAQARRRPRRPRRAAPVCRIPCGA